MASFKEPGELSEINEVELNFAFFWVEEVDLPTNWAELVNNIEPFYLSVWYHLDYSVSWKCFYGKDMSLFTFEILTQRLSF